VVFSVIFVNTNLTKGLFVAPSGVSVNTNPTKGHKENLLSHLPCKRRRGEVERHPLAGSLDQLSPSHSLPPLLLVKSTSFIPKLFNNSHYLKTLIVCCRIDNSEHHQLCRAIDKNDHTPWTSIHTSSAQAIGTMRLEPSESTTQWSSKFCSPYGPGIW
jgi:hypothetical protein